MFGRDRTIKGGIDVKWRRLLIFILSCKLSW